MKRRLRSRVLLGIAVFVLVVTASQFVAPPMAAQSDEASPVASIRAKDLTEGEWRLWGDFQVLPLAGYPITFKETGEVVSPNLPLLRHWALDGTTLTLSGADGRPDCTLKFDGKRGVFYTPGDADADRNFSLRIGRAGLTLSDVNHAGSPE